MIIRGRVLHFLEEPKTDDSEGSYEYIEEGALLTKEGRIWEIGNYQEIRKKYPNFDVMDHRNDLIFPGFIDLHNHFPQVQVIGSYGT